MKYKVYTLSDSYGDVKDKYFDTFAVADKYYKELVESIYNMFVDLYLENCIYDIPEDVNEEDFARCMKQKLFESIRKDIHFEEQE